MTSQEQPLPDRWTTRDLPILLEIARRLDEGDHVVQASTVAKATDRDRGEVIQAFNALIDSYVVGKVHRAVGGPVDAIARDLTERGRRTVGLWPSGEGVDALVDALRQAEEATDDPEEKSALRRAAGSVMSVSRDVMVDVLGAVIARQSGMG